MRPRTRTRIVGVIAVRPVAALVLGAALFAGCVDKELYLDVDTDGVPSGPDCDDDDPTVHPGLDEKPHNGVDDNCNGEIDEPTDTNDWDGDHVTKAKGDCDDTNPGVFPGAPERCNFIDDDCNQAIDDNNAEGGGTCTKAGAVGLCAVGVLNCVEGELTCQPHAAEAETCNGVDDDCNGSTDESDPALGGACPIQGQNGPCATGVTDCVGGALFCRQIASPSTELCNAVDDDCNGAVDDGAASGGACTVPNVKGVCTAGTQTCSAGQPSCQQDVAATAEVCNGLDDDCNGQVDDGVPELSCTVPGASGACATGSLRCIAGATTCAQTVTPVSEVCDGTSSDENCNGQVDESDPRAGTACSTGLSGACAAGIYACTGGNLTCVGTVQAGQQSESCNGIDDDCDGLVDEDASGVVGETCVECVELPAVSFLVDLQQSDTEFGANGPNVRVDITLSRTTGGVSADVCVVMAEGGSPQDCSSCCTTSSTLASRCQPSTVSVPNVDWSRGAQDTTFKAVYHDTTQTADDVLAVGTICDPLDEPTPRPAASTPPVAAITCVGDIIGDDVTWASGCTVKFGTVCIRHGP